MISKGDGPIPPPLRSPYLPRRPPMTLSSEKRREINRDNAKHSTGPKSDVGKAHSRFNALKHGLRAETLALPNEDPAELAAREHEWNDYYRPCNPGEAYLVQQAVRATIQLDRCAPVPDRHRGATGPS